MNPRNWISSVVQDLRARRLLPVLGLLVAAAIAIPVLLSQSGKPAALAAVPPATAAAPTTTAPTLAVTAPSRREPAQNYLTGPDHDPFNNPATRTSTTSAKPVVAPSSGTAATAANSGSAAANGSGSGGASSSHGSTGVPAASPGSTVTVVKKTPLPKCPKGETPGIIGGKDYCVTLCKKGQLGEIVNRKFTCVTPVAKTTTSYVNYAVDATVGNAGQAGTVYHHLSRFDLLPNDHAPVAEFLGVEAADKKTAVFWVSATATVSGGAHCSPSASTCVFVAVRPGDVFYVRSSANGITSDYRIRYDSVTKVHSDGFYPIDPTGQELVARWASASATLKSLSYSPDTGLMSIDLGTSQPTIVDRSSNQLGTQTNAG